jgi:hypothetical protein
MRLFRAAMALTFLVSATANAAERIYVPGEPGFVMGYQAANAEQSIQEWVPSGETVEAWTRMLTFQRFTGLVQRGRPGPALLEWIAGRIAAACPGARSSAVTRSIVLGRESAMLVTRCPLNPATGKPETTFYRAITAASDVHVAQVAFRSVPDAVAEKHARDYLAKVVLCGNALSDALPVCKGR